MKIMITPWSLTTLHGIANSPLGQYVHELEIGPERLNSRIMEDFVSATNTFADIKRSWTYNDMHQGWKKTGYKSWKRDYMVRVHKLVQEQREMETTHQDIALLTEILLRLPNLRSVRVVSSFANSIQCPKNAPLGMRMLLHEVGEQLLPRRENPRPSFDPVLISYQMLVVHDRRSSHIHFETVTKALGACDRYSFELELQLFSKVAPPLRTYNTNSCFYTECCSRLRKLVLDFGPLGVDTMAHNQETSFSANCRNLTALRIENGRGSQVSNYVRRLPRINSWQSLQKLELNNVLIEADCMMQLAKKHHSTLRWISLVKVHTGKYNKSRWLEREAVSSVWKDILSVFLDANQLNYMYLEELTTQSKMQFNPNIQVGDAMPLRCEGKDLPSKLKLALTLGHFLKKDQYLLFCPFQRSLHGL
jgi:hypothetical protein